MSASAFRSVMEKNSAFNIVYASEKMIAVYKPSGLSVLRKTSRKDLICVQDALTDILPDKSICAIKFYKIIQAFKKFYLGPIVPTQIHGIQLVFPSESERSEYFNLLNGNLVNHVYYAVVIGKPKNSKGTIDIPTKLMDVELKYRKNFNSTVQTKRCKIYKSVPELRSLSSEAIGIHINGVRTGTTHYKNVYSTPPLSKQAKSLYGELNFSLLKFMIQNGKLDQIRAHTTDILKCSILGDTLYGHWIHQSNSLRRCLDIKNIISDESVKNIPLCLAQRKIIISPNTCFSETPLSICCPPNHDLTMIISKLGMRKV